MMQPALNTSDHSRDSAGLTYVYPVVSRRAGGVSIGINLNPNNACNWRCIYCQVPGLARGGAPEADLGQLEWELRQVLADVVHGGFMARRVPAVARRLADVAFSGNGEPTSSHQFAASVELVQRVLEDQGLAPNVRLRLITNGSLLGRSQVRAGIGLLGRYSGEVWFKVDGGDPASFSRINSVRQRPETVVARLRACAGLCTTWVQTCCFGLDGELPPPEQVEAWLKLLVAVKEQVAGVHLYGLARQSQQAEAARLSPLPLAWLQSLARRVRKLGLSVTVNP